MAETAADRVCFLLHLKPDRVDGHVAAHEHVWPESVRPDEAMKPLTEYFHLD